VRLVEEYLRACLCIALWQSKFEANQTFDDIAAKTGLTNVYVGQLFHQQV
jgi:cyanate lyase